MEKEGGNRERMRKCREPISLHFLIFPPFPPHFLILSSFPRSPAARLQRFVQPWVAPFLKVVSQSLCLGSLTPDQIYTSWSIIKYNPTIFWTHIIGPSVLISSSNLRHMMISISSFITIPYIVTQTQLTTHNKLKINFKIWTKSWSQLSFIGLTNIQLNVSTKLRKDEAHDIHDDCQVKWCSSNWYIKTLILSSNVPKFWRIVLLREGVK